MGKKDSAWKDYKDFQISHELKKFRCKKEEYDFSQLSSYEYIEDGAVVTKSKGGLGRAIVGGMIAGGVGAIVGASTAKQESKEIINKSHISIRTEPDKKEHIVWIIISKTKKGSILYDTGMMRANNILNELKAIEQFNEEQTSI